MFRIQKLKNEFSELNRLFEKDESNLNIQTKLNELIDSIDPSDYITSLKNIFNYACVRKYPESILKLVHKTPIEKIANKIDYLLPNDKLSDDRLLIIVDIYDKLSSKTQGKINNKLKEFIVNYIFSVSRSISILPSNNILIMLGTRYNIDLGNKLFNDDFLYIPDPASHDSNQIKHKFQLIFNVLNLFKVNGENAFDIYYKMATTEYASYRIHIEILNELKMKKDIDAEIKQLDNILVESFDEKKKRKL